MANITTQSKTGYRIIQFTAADGKRKSFRIGRASLKAAKEICSKVEAINSAKMAKVSLDNETATWVGSLDSHLYGKLVDVGLVPKRREADETELGPWLRAYIARRTDVKRPTLVNWGHTKRNLLEFFGEIKPIDEITEGDAEDFERFLKSGARENKYGDIEKTAGLSPGTVAKRMSNAKQFFADAIKRKQISSNPFEGLGSKVGGNKGRQFFVSTADAQKVLDACPDDESRVIFALSRYGGLRCPSEHVLLKWSDVDWGNGRMTVRSPKTEHHEGKESREVPIFPELFPYLRKIYDSRDGAEFVITKTRDAGKNWRTPFLKIIKRAGVKPWPKLFQNLRSTRETELCETFPIHVVCEWIGNSQAVAKEHYLQVTDAHFEQASARAAVKQENGVMQPLAAIIRKATQELGIPCHGNDLERLVARVCEASQGVLMGDEGLEPPTLSV
jgi:integrase